MKTLSYMGKTSTKTKINSRVIGRYTCGIAGPLVIGIGGIHGNEPSGVIALNQVFRWLNQNKPLIRGSFLGLAGNIQALALGVRYIQEDLNRIWGKEQVHGLKADTTEAFYEKKEQQELYNYLKAELNNYKDREIYVLDLHTTSAKSEPFATISDTIRNRLFAEKFSLPLILGLEEALDGTLLSYVNELGHIAVGIESGEHQAASSIEVHAAALWVALVEAGCLKKEDIPDYNQSCTILKNATDHNNEVFEVCYRYKIEPQENFSMKNGFRNFKNIVKGQLLAHNQHNKIYALKQGKILMPLYQDLGEDGFFIIREVNKFWLKLSYILRLLQAHYVLTLLPGVKKVPSSDNTLKVNTHIARFYAREIFHLFGFRKARRNGQYLVFSKRKFDLKRPDSHTQE